MRTIAATLALAALLAPLPARAAPPAPVYIHMNGGNYFLEPVVVVRPGQQVVFVNQDTDGHTIVGYDAATGDASSSFAGTVLGTKGPEDKVATYALSFAKPGIESYFCSVHAELKPTLGKAVQPVKLKTTHGFAGPMAGVIVVTADPALLAHNPPTTAEKIVPGFFGG